MINTVLDSAGATSGNVVIADGDAYRNQKSGEAVIGGGGTVKASGENSSTGSTENKNSGNTWDNMSSAEKRRRLQEGKQITGNVKKSNIITCVVIGVAAYFLIKKIK